jgi:RNA polymerase-binding transcription factor
MIRNQAHAIVWESACFVLQVSLENGLANAKDRRRTIMTTIERDRFRTALKNREAELENGNRSREGLAVETYSDELDRIQHGQERDFAIGTLDRNSKLLREVRAALSRIDAGEFGICLGCEEEIGMKRLAAVPWTSSCIICQEAADSLAGKPWTVGAEPLASAA